MSKTLKIYKEHSPPKLMSIQKYSPSLYSAGFATLCENAFLKISFASVKIYEFLV